MLSASEETVICDILGVSPGDADVKGFKFKVYGSRAGAYGLNLRVRAMQSTTVREAYQILTIWEFPKIGDPNIVP